jgi:hypothetical protein
VRSVAQLAALALLWDAVRIDLARKLVVDEVWKVIRPPSVFVDGFLEQSPATLPVRGASAPV